MTPYEQGFMNKCAEYGLTEKQAVNLLGGARKLVEGIRSKLGPKPTQPKQAPAAPVDTRPQQYNEALAKRLGVELPTGPDVTPGDQAFALRYADPMSGYYGVGRYNIGALSGDTEGDINFMLQMAADAMSPIRSWDTPDERRAKLMEERDIRSPEQMRTVADRYRLWDQGQRALGDVYGH